MNEEIETGSDAEVESEGSTATQEQVKEGYWCVVCGRFLSAQESEGGLIVHDAVPHPSNMTFGDQEHPQ